MNLGQLIDALEALPQDAMVKDGFGRPYSYRGYYDQVAFEPLAVARIGDMLAHAKGAIGPTFTGYKGGDYKYDRDTECWIAPWSETVEESIGKADIERWSGMVSIAASELDKLRAEVERLQREIGWAVREAQGDHATVDREISEARVAVPDVVRRMNKATAAAKMALASSKRRGEELDEARAEVERLRALDKEAKSAFAPWVQGPGIVGGILHLQEEVERLRAEANARAVEELALQAEGCDMAASGWVCEREHAKDNAHRDRLESRIDQLRGVAFHIRKRIAELSKPAAKESKPVRGGEKIETWVDDWTVSLADGARGATGREVVKRKKMTPVRAWALACGHGAQFCSHWTDDDRRFIYRVYETRDDAVGAAASTKHYRVVEVEIREAPKRRKAVRK